MKTCSKCGDTKAYSEYHVRRASRDGLMPTCKACVKAHDKAYYDANVDRIKARQAEYYKANADQIRAQHAEHYKANADRIKAHKADYYKANRDQIEAYRAENVDRIKARQADYRKANADQIRAHRAANPHIGWESNYRTRCRKLGLVPVIESFTREQMIAYWGNGERCIYCDAPAVEIDHMIPVGLGGHHVIENVAPSCGPCNRVNIWTVRITRKTLTKNA